jgi:hypothetical protein
MQFQMLMIKVFPLMRLLQMIPLKQKNDTHRHHHPHLYDARRRLRRQRQQEIQQDKKEWANFQLFLLSIAPANPKRQLRSYW